MYYMYLCLAKWLDCFKFLLYQVQVQPTRAHLVNWLANIVFLFAWDSKLPNMNCISEPSRKAKDRNPSNREKK